MFEIRIQNEDKAVQSALGALAGKVKNLSPVMKIIGEYMLRSTEERFNSQGPSPDGKPWAPLKASTLKRKKHSKILTESGHLRGSIRYQLQGTSAVAIGTNKEYGAIHQLGGQITQGARSETFLRKRHVNGEKKGSFKKGTTAGRGFTFGEKKINIPARPYLGVSARDSTEIVGIVNRYLSMR
ncbi:MAG: phage virion morphogenesis protein [Pseudomonadota bacterium]